MTKVMITLLAGIIMLIFTSCARETEGYSIREALKISAIVFDESIEENIYNEDGTVYTLERLEMNKVKLAAPLRVELWSVTFFIEFNGIIEVTSDNEDVWMYWGRSPNWVDSSRTVGGGGNSEISVRTAVESYVSINPLPTKIVNVPTLRDDISFVATKEWYLNVNAYRFDNEDSPIIRARLRILDMNDIYDQQDDSNFFSVELISYEYSDIYKFMDDVVDDEDYE